MNNTVVVVETIGEEENGLACVTTKEVCCRVDRLGNFYFPDGIQLSSTGEGGDIFTETGRTLGLSVSTGGMVPHLHWELTHVKYQMSMESCRTFI